MTRFKSRRLWLITLTTLLIAGAGVGGAVAAFPDTNVETYSGCLSTGGAGGEISKVAVGLDPTKPCPSGQRLIHLSGGDITAVSAGTGLSGGGDNGAVTLSLDAAHSLPQGCPAGDVAKSDGSNSWGCAKDEDTTYTAGRGLELSGTQFQLAAPKVYSKKDDVDCAASPSACKRGEGIFVAIATCPDGAALLSGGAWAYRGSEPVLGSSPDFVLTASSPGFDDAGRPTGWFAFATFTRDVTAGKFTIFASAICSTS
jgi:hypothetical protein